MTTVDSNQTADQNGSRRIGRRFRVGEVLTLRSGTTWRVDDLHDHDGRPGVDLVNPFDPGHGIGLHADVLAEQVAERAAPPPLCTTRPPCSICYRTVVLEDNFYVCQGCNCSWPIRGLDEVDGDWDDDLATQCTALIRPYADPTRDQRRERRETIYRCVLDHDHDPETDPHKHPEYDREWDDEHPRALPAGSARGKK